MARRRLRASDAPKPEPASGEPLLYGHYRDYPIYITPMGDFAVRLEGSNQDNRCDTLDELLIRIDAFWTKKSKGRTLDLPAVFLDGAAELEIGAGSVTGINLHTDAVTGLVYEHYLHAFYPDVPWIRELLARRVRQNQELYETDEKLKPFRIEAERRARMAYQDYGERIDALEREYNEKRELAEEGR